MNDLKKFRKLATGIMMAFPNVKTVTISYDNNERMQYIDLWKTYNVRYFSEGFYSTRLSRYYNIRFRDRGTTHLMCSLPLAVFNIGDFNISNIYLHQLNRNEVGLYKTNKLTKNNFNDLKNHLMPLKHVLDINKIKLVSGCNWEINNSQLAFRGSGLRTNFRGEINFS